MSILYISLNISILYKQYLSANYEIKKTNQNYISGELLAKRYTIYNHSKYKFNLLIICLLLKSL